MKIDAKSPEGQALLKRAFQKKKSPKKSFTEVHESSRFHDKKRKKAAATKPKYDIPFFALLKENDLPMPEPEYHFHDTRLWRADYSFKDQRILLEVEGGIWTQGRHTRGEGYKKDMEKYTEAALEWWRVFRVTPDGLVTMKTIELLKRAFKNAHYLQLPDKEDV